MRYQRVELHNHSTESDGEMTAAELMRWAEKEAYGVVRDMKRQKEQYKKNNYIFSC